MSATASAPPASRRTITTVTSYEAAERAVDFLSDHDFPVEHVTIVGTGLRYVEQVSRRLTTGNAALLGAGSCALLRLLWGLLFGLFFHRRLLHLLRRARLQPRHRRGLRCGLGRDRPRRDERPARLRLERGHPRRPL